MPSLLSRVTDIKEARRTFWVILDWNYVSAEQHTNLSPEWGTRRSHIETVPTP